MIGRVLSATYSWAPSRGRAGAIFAALSLALTTLLAPAPFAQAQTALRDYAIPGGWFYSQESRDPSDNPPYRGFTVLDDTEASFWTEFRRYGGVEVLGYPVTRRYRYPAEDGFIHQAFQRGVLQWRPDEGRAHVANIFEQFTEQGEDDDLETMGIPKPRPGTQLPFHEDAARRMAWITEPRFLARFLFNPFTQTPFETQEAAWAFFGLPQTHAERPVYLREKANGKYGYPLYQTYVVQRFQKAALQMFLEDQPLDPTIVPGDGKKGCVTITAAGRLARRLGAGTVIPRLASQPEPPDLSGLVKFLAFVPPAISAGQRTTQFELIATGFEPGEPVTITLTPADDTQPLPRVRHRVDAAAGDGSLDEIITARVGIYVVSMQGEQSGKALNPDLQDPTLDLTVPTEDTSAYTRATYC